MGLLLVLFQRNFALRCLRVSCEFYQAIFRSRKLLLRIPSRGDKQEIIFSYFLLTLPGTNVGPSSENYLHARITFRVYPLASDNNRSFLRCFAGKEVVGEYTIKEPGGNIRTVKYRAGKDGFFAHVLNSDGNDHSGGHHH